MARQFSISVLFTRGDKAWVAQCLEYDIAAQGDSISEAKKAFEATFIGTMVLNARRGRDLLDDVPAAPKLYWEQFNEGQRLAERQPFYMPSEVAPCARVTAEDMRVAA